MELEPKPQKVIFIDISHLVFLTPLDIDDKVWRELREVQTDFPDLLAVFQVKVRPEWN